MTATKICAWRTSLVSRSTITGTVSPCAINEQFIATQVGLAHRHRKLGFPAAVEFAKRE